VRARTPGWAGSSWRDCWSAGVGEQCLPRSCDRQGGGCHRGHRRVRRARRNTGCRAGQRRGPPPPDRPRECPRAAPGGVVHRRHGRVLDLVRQPRCRARRRRRFPGCLRRGDRCLRPPGRPTPGRPVDAAGTRVWRRPAVHQPGLPAGRVRRAPPSGAQHPVLAPGRQRDSAAVRDAGRRPPPAIRLPDSGKVDVQRPAAATDRVRPAAVAAVGQQRAIGVPAAWNVPAAVLAPGAVDGAPGPRVRGAAGWPGRAGGGRHRRHVLQQRICLAEDAGRRAHARRPRHPGQPRRPGPAARHLDSRGRPCRARACWHTAGRRSR